MWDPRTYEDTDYGLDEGESFEPDLDLDDEPPFDRSMPHIMTVLGPIEPEELGVCLPATRFMPHPTPGQSDRERTRFVAEAAEELEAFASVGGRAAVDTATATTGRDIPALQRLTQLVPSHLIAAAGFPAGDDDILAGLEREVRDGLDGSGVLPGLIAVRASDLAANDRLPATIGVASRSGIPLLVDLPSWEEALPVLAACRAAESTPSAATPALILSGPASLPSEDIVAEAARTGAFIVLRAAGPGHPREEAMLAQAVVALCRAGLGAHLLLTMDLRVPQIRLAMPTEPRATYLIDRLALALMEAGASALDVRHLMIENPARALTIVPAPDAR